MAKDFIKEQIAVIEAIVNTKAVDRLYIENGYLNVAYADGRNVNLGFIQGEPGKPGEQGPALDIAEVVQEVLSKIPTPKDGEPGKNGRDGNDGKNGKDGTTPDIQEIIDAVLAKIELPKDGKNGIDGANGIEGVSPNIEEIVDAVRKLIPTPKNGEDGKPGEPGAPGKDAPFSTHLKIIDLLATTNQDHSGKQIFDLPVYKFATVTVDIIGAGATQFFSTKKSASFKVGQKVTEDQIERATKRSNPEYDAKLVETASGFAIVIKGSDTEEMEWAGTVVINEIS